MGNSLSPLPLFDFNLGVERILCFNRPFLLHAMAADESIFEGNPVQAYNMLADQDDADDPDDLEAIKAIMDLFGYPEEVAREMWQGLKDDMEVAAENR
ncbi:MAG TPA: hypothetical protein VM934_14950 [Pyrinomonadaceae bacterium]|jgi:hypothetical protein|nr:hypothetical protein [Pyrinomonadaceae bacterium]